MARRAKRTVMDLDEWRRRPWCRLPPGKPCYESGPSVDRPRLVLAGAGSARRHDRRPVRERSDRDSRADHFIANGLAKTGFDEVGLLSLSSADHSEIGPIAKQLADRYEGTNTSSHCHPHTGGRIQHRVAK